MYDASANVLRGEFKHGGPVLDCCFHDDSSGFSASGDSTVRRYEISIFVSFFLNFSLILISLGVFQSYFDS